MSGTTPNHSPPINVFASVDKLSASVVRITCAYFFRQNSRRSEKSVTYLSFFGNRLVQGVVFEILSSVWKNPCCWRESCTGTLTCETTQRLQPRRAMHNMKELMFQEREKMLDLSRRLRVVLLGWRGSWLSMSCGRWRGWSSRRTVLTNNTGFVHSWSARWRIVETARERLAFYR